MNRWKASGLHLCLSLLVIGSIAALVFSQWYPHGLSRIAGLDRLFVIMLGIDIVAGPLLTLIVYNRAKPELRRDLAIIGLMQLGFLAYGLQTTWKSRPVFLVGATDQLTLVFASEIADKDLAQAQIPELRKLSWTGPRYVGTRMPTDPALRREAMVELMAGGSGIERSPKRYLAYAAVVSELLQHAHPVQGVAKISDADIRATGLPREQLRWLPIASSRGSGVALVNARTAEPLRVLALDSNELQ